MERRHIREAVDYLFQRYGIRGISMDDISRYKGISKKTLYQLYSNKDAVVIDYVSHNVETIFHSFQDWICNEQNPKDKIRLLNVFLIKLISGINQSMLHDIEKYHPLANLLVRQATDSISESMSRIIADGQHKGVFRMDIDARLLTEIRMRDLTLAMRETRYSMHRQYQIFAFYLSGLLRH
jgi:TetR/AcrR family transcriptional regulator, cholesterol catabolism regulator